MQQVKEFYRFHKDGIDKFVRMFEATYASSYPYRKTRKPLKFYFDGLEPVNGSKPTFNGFYSHIYDQTKRGKMRHEKCIKSEYGRAVKHLMQNFADSRRRCKAFYFRHENYIYDFLKEKFLFKDTRIILLENTNEGKLEDFPVTFGIVSKFYGELEPVEGKKPTFRMFKTFLKNMLLYKEAQHTHAQKT